MALYLGVDGGGTGCRAVLADAGGCVLGRGSAGSANIWSDPEGALGSILRAAGQALAAGAPGVGFSDVIAVLGLAGANVSGAAERVAPLLPFGRVVIESDAVMALKGALGASDGIAATIGTGSVFGVQRAGVVRMIGGWGFQLGDHGSGTVMGRALCVRALLAHDGEVAGSPVLARVVARHGGPMGLIAWGKGATPAEFAALVPEMLEAAAAGDAGAEAVLAEAEAGVARAIDRLLAEGPVPVCFLGGLGPLFAGRLGARYGALVREPEGSGLDGALRLARTLG